MSDVQSAGIFLARELEQKLPKLYEKKFPQYWASEGKFHRANPTLELGTSSVIESISEGRGEAVALAEYNSAFPTADVGMAETAFKVMDFAASIEYTVLQLWAAEKAGKDIVTMKLNQAYKVLQEKIHRHAVFGNTKYSHQGLFSSSLVTTTVSAYNPNTSTWQQDLDFFRAQLSAISDGVNGTANTGTILVPPRLRFKLASTYQTGDSGATVLQALMDNFGTASGGFLRGIVAANECRSSDLEAAGVQAAGSNLDRVVFLPDTEDFAERLYYPVVQLPAQLQDTVYRVILIQGTSEMIWHYPKEAQYVTITRML